MKQDEIIEILQCGDDSGLAKLLNKNKSTVSRWRTSGEIPAKVERELLQLISEKQRELKDIAEGDTCIHVDIYNMVEAGNGAEPEWHEPIDRRAIPVRYLKNGTRPILVRGRSMEPTFKNGAIIGIDQNDKQVVEGEAYAIILPYAGAAVKRLYPLPDGVLIRSDNKEFPEVKLLKADVPDYFILGRVCWVVQEV